MIPAILTLNYQHISLSGVSNYEDRANELIRSNPIIDGHNDLPWALGSSRAAELNISKTSLDTDIIRMRKGGLSGQFWSAYIPCKAVPTIPNNYIKDTLEQIDLIRRMVDQNPDLRLIYNADEFRTTFSDNKIGSMIGIEGGHQIDESFAALRLYYQLGVRYMTLTHVCHTTWADSCSYAGIHNGLTGFGKQVIKEMNKLGMMVDISHVSHKVMRDVIKITKAPLFASHSSVASLCNTTRNIPDDVLLAMKRLDGVIMVNFWPKLISCSNMASIDQVLNHIIYIVNIAGAAHVGFGGDFDGISEHTNGLRDVSKYPSIIAGLLHVGLSDSDVIGIMGDNLIRVLRKSEDVAKRFI